MITNSNWRWAVMAGLTLGSLALVPNAAADSTNLLARTTFDVDGPAGWGYGYFYSDNGLGTYEGPDRAYYEATDPEQTNAVCRYGFDLSALQGNSNYGTGFGAPQYQADADPALFISADRADYIFSFDARVEGLKTDHTSANAEMQVQFLNTAATPNNILQVNLAFAPGATWGHFTFRLDGGGFGAETSDKTFAAGYQGITGLQFNVNVHVPSDSFDFDADNAVLLDNLVLEVVAKAVDPNPPSPTFATTFLDWNFDDKPITSSYPYGWTEHGEQPVLTATPNAAASGVDNSNGWMLQMDNSALANDVPSWAGGGTGGEGPVDYAGFSNGNLGAYKLTFDARVEGLAPEKASTTCVLQLFLRAQDDVVLPADSDTNRDVVVQVNFPLTGLDANWQNIGLVLDKGSVAAGSKENFSTYNAKIDQLQMQWQIENAADAAVWGFDADNALVVDNVKLERIDVGCPALVIGKYGGDLFASWSSPATGSAKLQSSTSATGNYTDVAGATSPYVVPVDSKAKFFRTVWVAPAQ